jgi:hypothetical protein
MDLKNAVAICLISLFSATLVVLIARWLDVQSASRLEVQLERIAEELEAIRRSGGFAAIGAEGETGDDTLVAYYFHGNFRCATCRAIQSQAHETVHNDFASELDAGQLVWKVRNFDERSGVEIANRFDVGGVPVVVLAKMKDGQIKDWRRLDRVWSLVNDKPAFADFLRDQISEMLAAAETPPADAPYDAAVEIPTPEPEPDGPSESADPAEIPVPQ